ncbi:sodium/glutamate symporter [Terrihabitans soli]|uniref:Sodium/glutamate symporter n=1 Tax=Terrihabitans soli TaxID=708113 RepID=A0A6S6QUR5_9HYPH|nr:sodium/glutamate symporter [Terrihabitans soli]BCJ90992.1 sodium/glutamate symporter [Terrihabitans soli]
MSLTSVATLFAAAGVLLLGTVVNRSVPFLSRYAIPDPITGGLIFALAAWGAQAFAGFELRFDPVVSGPLLLAFFASVGLSADFRDLGRGGLTLIRYLLVLAPFVALQNVIGIFTARAIDLPPTMGLIVGSITLVGGHGTGAAYASLFDTNYNLTTALPIAMAAATFGLILGGVTGGPVGNTIITRFNLSGQKPRGRGREKTEVEIITVTHLISALAAITICMLIGDQLASLMADAVVKLPAFVWALLTGVILRNVFQIAGIWRMSSRPTDLLGGMGLGLFLALAMMQLRLWEFADLVGPLAVILIAQTIACAAYAIFVAFPGMGRDYDAALMAAGVIGFCMGSTATAVAITQALEARHGPSRQARLIVPLTGAFFIDLVNAAILAGFLSMRWFS